MGIVPYSATQIPSTLYDSQLPNLFRLRLRSATFPKGEGLLCGFADVHPSDAGVRIATPVCGLVYIDMIFIVCVDFYTFETDVEGGSRPSPTDTVEEGRPSDDGAM